MKTIIKGCDARGDGDTPYLTRWSIIRWPRLHLYLHKFHRSDADELHDHPWHFISIVLWRGYIEETFIKPPAMTPRTMLTSSVPETSAYKFDAKLFTTRKRIYPGMIIFRKATHAHRVILINDKPAYTLLINFGYVRQWGFYTKKYWQHFVSYFKDNGCNTAKNV